MFFDIIGFIGIYLLPLICIIFVVKSVDLAKQIKNGDTNTENNTTWVAITFTIIVYTLVTFSWMS
ncbi:hypothetical protein ACFSO7_08965 [Bacillus sp. CGMCC 1.16607]|uniref:hypothetical protein n=1 Tax=Bacillus sp. CGMCC 1.16607 TaxID=3351842 RepID=UPI0036274C9E